MDRFVKKRLEVLKLAEKTGNVSEACRLSGVDRSSFYKWKRRFRLRGVEGLRDSPPVHKHHPQKTPDDIVERIKDTALKHPAWGCNRIERYLRLEGTNLSSVSIQKILIANDLGRRRDRWLALDNRYVDWAKELSREQISFIESFNLCFCDRDFESSEPGQFLFADTFNFQDVIGGRSVFFNIVVDTYSSYSFGIPSLTKSPEIALAVLQYKVLPFFQSYNLAAGAMRTDKGREFVGAGFNHPYMRFIRSNLRGKERERPWQDHHNWGNTRQRGFIQRFRLTMRTEFLKKHQEVRPFSSLTEVRSEFDTWLYHYNNERPHLGYRNYGRTPNEVIEQFVSTED